MENSFGSFLREKRKEKGLTQKELSGLLYVSESLVSKWEKNVAHPDITLLPKLSEILGVSEHELITASVDNKAREERTQARKWRILSFSWSLFFYIAYGVALIPCFICNLAINKTLSWFWIVLSALVLAFTFTNLPSMIKKHRLILIPSSMYAALVLLLGVSCIYTRGDWFIIPTLSVLLGLVIIFMPIIISKYEAFSKVRKFNDFVSCGIDFILLNILLIVINIYTVVNNYTENTLWYIKIALPIVLAVYFCLNVLLSVRFLKINKFLKTSIIMFLVNVFLYVPPLFIKLRSEDFENLNIFKANLSSWTGATIENNVHLIISLSMLLIAVVFFAVGMIRHKNKKKAD